jgi:hypothetical protein
MNINDLIKLAQLLDNKPSSECQATGLGSWVIGKHCVVRGRDSGLHIGEVVALSGTEVILRNSRRMYYFKHKTRALCTLSEVAIEGIDSAASKICIEVVEPQYFSDKCEIIPTTEIARKTFEASHAK